VKLFFGFFVPHRGKNSQQDETNHKQCVGDGCICKKILNIHIFFAFSARSRLINKLNIAKGRLAINS
jgi:hypothetical protein